MELIENSKSLFISYGRGDDEEFVFKLYKDLSDRDYKVWHDKSGGLESNGLSFLANIRNNINSSTRLLLIIGPHASRSDYVKAEFEYALTKCLVIIPILRMGNKKDENNEPVSSEKDYDLIPAPIKKRNLHSIDFRSERKYEAALQELLQSLQKDILPLVIPSSVPNQPPNFITRNDEIEKIKEIVMADSYKAGVITSTAKNTAVQGMGGIGKSVIAAALCHDCDIRRSFQDGIYWISIGQKKLNLQSRLQEITKDNTIDLRDRYDESKIKIQAFLNDKNCLLVLDDVWEQKDIEIFPSDIALRCRILITTRNKQAVKNYSNEVVEIGLLNMLESKQLLLKAVNKGIAKFSIDNLPIEANSIIEECGFLPLAIDMAGGMISSGDTDKWKSILKRLQKADLEKIRRDFLDYPYPNLFKVLEVSVNALNDNDRSRYLQLAIFPKDVHIPKRIVEIIWVEKDFDDLDADDLLDDLVQRSLLIRTSTNDFTIHDLQVDFITKTSSNIKQLNKEFIFKLGDPLNLPHKYAWDYYIWHLKEAGEEEKGLMLLINFNWIEAKLFATDIYALLNDYELLVLDDFLKDEIYKALRLSSYILSQYKDQLAAHFIIRIKEDERTKLFLNDCKNYSRIPWLRPVILLSNKSIQPDRIYKTYEDQILKIATNAKYLIASNIQGNIFKWDKINGKLIKKLNAHQGPVNDILLTEEYLVTCGSDALIKVWNLENDEVYLGSGHKDSVWRLHFYQDNIISASNDGTIRIWSLDLRELDKITSLPNVISQIEIYADKLLLCSCEDIIYIYNVENREQVNKFEHFGKVMSFIVLDNKIISVAKDESLRIWEINSGYLIANIPIKQKYIDKMVSSGAFVFISSLKEATLLVLNIETDEIAEYPLNTRNGINAIIISPEYLIVSLYSNSIRIFDIKYLSKSLDLFGTASVSGCLFIDGKILYTGTAGGMVYSYNLNSINPVFLTDIIAAKDQDLGYVTNLIGDNEKLFLNTISGHLQCWDFKDNKLLFSLNEKSLYSLIGLNFCTYHISLSNQFIGTGDWDGNIKFWHIENGKFSFSTHEFFTSFDSIQLPEFIDISRNFEETLGVYCIQISNDIIAAATVTGYLRFWNIISKEEVGRVYFGESPLSTYITNDFLLLPLVNGDLLLINKSTFILERTLKGHKQLITSFEMYKGNLITASADGNIKLWSLDQINLLRTINAHNAPIIDIKVYNNMLISCSTDSTMKIWNLDTYELIDTIAEVQEFYSLKVSNDTLIACSRSGLICAYDLKNSFQEIAKFISDDLPYFFQVSEKYNKIAFGGHAGKLHFLEAVGFEL